MTRGRPTEDQPAAHGQPLEPSLTGFRRSQLLLRATGVAAGLGSLGGIAAACGSSSSSTTGTSSGGVARGGTMQIATDQMFEGDSLDPIKAINDGQGIAQGMIRETLTQLNKDQQPIPYLATWTTNSNFTKYTLSLKRGITFHSGKELTAADAAYTIKRNLDPKNGSGLLSRLQPSLSPDGIVVSDDHTLVLNLKRPDSVFMSPMARIWMALVPDGATNFENGDGTGPFKLTSWVAGQSCQVVKYDKYWRSGLPYLDGVHMLQISEGSTKTESVMSGPSDMTEIDYQSLPLIKGSSAVDQILGHEFHLLNVAMNQTVKPYSDPRVREALKRSVDRNKLINVAFAGYGRPAADTIVPTDDPQFPPALMPRTQQDLAMAHQLMQEAGYPNGLHITLPVSSDTLHATFALAFAASVAGSPFTFTVQQHPGSTYWNQIWLHAPIFVSDWNRRLALEAFPEMLAGDANEPHFNSPVANKSVAQGYATTGAAQTTAVAPMLTVVSKTSGDVIPAYRHRIFVFKKNVKGLTVNPNTLYDMSKVWRAS